MIAGEHMVNRIPNGYFLTNKLDLLLTLKRYELVWSSLNLNVTNVLQASDFLPETYRMDVSSEKKAFFGSFKRTYYGH